MAAQLMMANVPFLLGWLGDQKGDDEFFVPSSDEWVTGGAKVEMTHHFPLIKAQTSNL